MRQLAADRRCNEDAWRKREAGKKATGGSSKPGRAMVARKGSKASGLGEDFSNSGSAETAENQGRQTKSEVAKREANEAWEEMKKGRVPVGYILVSPILFLSRSLLTIFNRRTIVIGARSHPESSGAIAGRMTSSARSASTTTDHACLRIDPTTRLPRLDHPSTTPHPFTNDTERGLSLRPAQSQPEVSTNRFYILSCC